MNTKDLAYFRTLVDTKSYTETANQFGVSQPTITLAIKRLESEFGDVPLISQPYPRAKLVVTRAGNVLYQQAVALLTQLAATHAEVKHAAEDSIRLGLSPVTGITWFPNAADQLLKVGILDDLIVTEAGSHQLLTELTNGSIDIALLAAISPLDDPKLNAKLLAVNPFKIIVSSQHKLASKAHIRFADLKHERFIAMNNKYIHAYALNAYATFANFNPNIIYQTSDTSMVRALVRRNIGVSLLVANAIVKEPGIKALTLTDALDVHSYMYLVTRKTFKPTQNQAFFMGLFQALSSTKHD